MEINPGTAPFVAVVYSNDAGTKLEVVSPSTPLPVSGSFTPSGTQDENIKQVNGATVNVGPGAAGTGTLRVTTSTDSTVTSKAPISNTFTPTQVTVPATANGILLLAANANRLGAIITNTGSSTIFISSAATGLTTTNGFAVPAQTAFSIDNPLYQGALYGIVAAGTALATVEEMT